MALAAIKGDRTVAELAVHFRVPWIEDDGGHTTKLPRVMEHRARMLARPAVRDAVAAEGTQIR